LHKQEKVTPSQGCEGNSQGRQSGFVEGHKKSTHERAHDNTILTQTLSLKERS